MCDKVVCVCDKGVCDKVVCEICERWCVTKLCVCVKVVCVCER